MPSHVDNPRIGPGPGDKAEVEHVLGELLDKERLIAETVGHRLHVGRGAAAGLLAGLDHHRVAADERGQALPRRDGHREIEWSN